MGLDQYLYARIVVGADDPLTGVIEENMTDEDREALDHRYEDGSGGTAYISGWDFPNRPPEPLYGLISAALGFVPHEGSPHINIRRSENGGFIVEPVVMYWRKCNQIHQWFVENCQGGIDECQESDPIHPEVLADLVERCDRITAAHRAAVPAGGPGEAMRAHDLASELLPTQGGFFFGSTDYDEWYWKDVEATAETLREQVFRLPKGATLFYRSSW